MGNGESIDIFNIDTTGASAVTARQDRLTEMGVDASEKLAETDQERMSKYKSEIMSVASECKIDPAVIAAIISRESRAGNTLKNGWGDHGNAYGLMQVDKRYHTPKGGWDSKEHLTQATEILIDSINKIKQKFPYWSKEQCFKGGLSAYNMGVGNVESYDVVDKNTTGGDYSNDVVARAQWFKSNGY